MHADMKVVFSNQNRTKRKTSLKLTAIKPSPIFCVSIIKALDNETLSYVCPPMISRYRSDGAIPNETRPGGGNAGIDRQIFFS